MLARVFSRVRYEPPACQKRTCLLWSPIRLPQIRLLDCQLRILSQGDSLLLLMATGKNAVVQKFDLPISGSLIRLKKEPRAVNIKVPAEIVVSEWILESIASPSELMPLQAVRLP